MANVLNNVNTLRTVKSDIKSSLESKGVSVTNDFTTYAKAIDDNWNYVNGTVTECKAVGDITKGDFVESILDLSKIYESIPQPLTTKYITVDDRTIMDIPSVAPRKIRLIKFDDLFNIEVKEHTVTTTTSFNSYDITEFAENKYILFSLYNSYVKMHFFEIGEDYSINILKEVNSPYHSNTGSFNPWVSGCKIRITKFMYISTPLYNPVSTFILIVLMLMRTIIAYGILLELIKLLRVP